MKQKEVSIASIREKAVEDRDVKRTTFAFRDEVVKAVLSRASNVARLVAQFTAFIGDPLEAKMETGHEFPEIACGGFVSPKDLKSIYEVYDELWPLQGRVSASRMKALEEGAALTPAERALYTKRRLAEYFAEPVEGTCYLIVAVISSRGRKAYWTEVREGDSLEGVRRRILDIFPSVSAAKAALRREGLISARDYPLPHRARRTKVRRDR